MSEPKFTPGPWEWYDYNHGDKSREDWIGILRGAFEIHGNPHKIGEVKFSALPQEQNFANARLIASAPDLYAALQASTELLRDYKGVCKSLTLPVDAMKAAVQIAANEAVLGGK